MSAVHSMLLQFAPAVPITWNASDKGANVTLSNGNLTMQCSSGSNCRVRATTSHSNGKYYFEMVADTIDATTNTPMMGLLLGSVTLNAAGWGAGGSNGYGVLPAPTMYARKPTGSSDDAGVGFSAADVFGFAVDFDAGKIWFARNNTWILSGNPAAGTSPVYSSLTGIYFPAAYANNGQVTARFASPSFGYTPPAGFNPW